MLVVIVLIVGETMLCTNNKVIFSRSVQLVHGISL
jgi:hypothetical protein